ncbi:hypothetical protein D3C81_1380890 [compost metagenome]
MMHMEYVALLALCGNSAQLQCSQLRIRTAVGEDKRFFTVCIIVNELVIILLSKLQMLSLPFIPGIREREMLHRQL